jgi:hypothetical protein
MLLSKTGCMDPKDPTKPAASLIPYTVVSPLWSDGASKQRFMALPDGTRAHIKNCTTNPVKCKSTAEGGTTPDEGHFEFPVGTVLVKNFGFRNKLIETRLFVKFTDDGTDNDWTGYTYAWNALQTEATIVAEDGVTSPITNEAGQKQDWYFPSRSDCVLCHNRVVGFALGPDVRNLNIDYTYPSGTKANQLDTLAHIGLLDAPVKKAPPFPDPSVGLTPTTNDPTTLDKRTRSYMNANCAICHRPEGNFMGLDLRFDADLKTMDACNVDPHKGTAPVTPADKAKLLVPGHPELSIMYARMATIDPQRRMPQVATSVLDPVGTRLVSDWIKTVVTTCPQ